MTIIRLIFLILLCICICIPFSSYIKPNIEITSQTESKLPILPITKTIDQKIDIIPESKTKEPEPEPPEPEQRIIPSYQDLIGELKLPTSLSLDEDYNIDYTIKSDRENIVTKIGDTLLLPPELLLDGTVSILNALFGQSSGNSVSSKIFDFHIQPTRSHLFSIMMTNLTRREQRYFGSFENSYFYTDDVEDGRADIDGEKLLEDQQKVLWDVFKDTYLSKYKLRLDDRVRDEAFNIADWSGIDFIMLPPLVVGYLYYRGYDKELSIFGSRLRVSIESINKLTNEDNILVGIGIEWAPYKHSPIKFIVATGFDDGDFGLQFIGIGTSLDTVKKALYLNSPNYGDPNPNR
jgi:hypothetical protein